MKHGLKPIELDVDCVVTKLRGMIESSQVDEAMGMASSLVRSLVEESNSNVFRLIKALPNQYGRKSEKVSPGQLMLALQELSTTMDLLAPIDLPP
ncbi:MAG TPA: transposase [Myxococcota bacterium]|nr:transposase [Myxococcota bacterium]HRY96977.1 transposase [Myxococcota bacterium]